MKKPLSEKRTLEKSALSDQNNSSDEGNFGTGFPDHPIDKHSTEKTFGITTELKAIAPCPSVDI
ncbi:MAG: hypothetical protein NW224_11055 [Leptolyngbyaceae cyanobacterium bins.302]|nr:hypothetical protein [Leptolyngbyaceae cyanobacterium bins.302]